jgi:hypothetical protein
MKIISRSISPRSTASSFSRSDGGGRPAGRRVRVASEPDQAPARSFRLISRSVGSFADKLLKRVEFIGAVAAEVMPGGDFPAVVHVHALAVDRRQPLPGQPKPRVDPNRLSATATASAAFSSAMARQSSARRGHLARARRGTVRRTRGRPLSNRRPSCASASWPSVQMRSAVRPSRCAPAVPRSRRPWALLAAQAKAHKMSVNAWVALNLTVHACAAGGVAPRSRRLRMIASGRMRRWRPCELGRAHRW